MVNIDEIIKFLEDNNIKYKYDGTSNYSVESFCPLNNVKNNSITWVRNTKDLDVNKLNSYVGILLLAEYDAKVDNASFPVLYVDNVHRSFFRILSKFFGDKDPDNVEERIEKSAIVESSEIGDSVYIGHHTYIGPDVVIGNHVKILNNVTIQGRVVIGDYTIIESGTVIGACGFGQYWDEVGNPVTVPHLGGVTIGKYVKIGANNSISRGCLADTVIEDYVQTDNLCHIAHNDTIKKGAILTANSVISGSTVVGENVWLAPGSLLNNAITVGKNAFLGLGAVATKDVPENKVVVGMPAKPLRDRY